MSIQYAIDNRTTEDVIVVAFLNWKEHVLYDSRKTPNDIPLALTDYPVEGIHVLDDNLTMIEI